MPTVTLNVNGVARALDLDPGEKLLWVIRERLGLPGAKYGLR